MRKRNARLNAASGFDAGESPALTTPPVSMPGNPRPRRRLRFQRRGIPGPPRQTGASASVQGTIADRTGYSRRLHPVPSRAQKVIIGWVFLVFRPKKGLKSGWTRSAAPDVAVASRHRLGICRLPKRRRDATATSQHRRNGSYGR